MGSAGASKIFKSHVKEKPRDEVDQVLEDFAVLVEAGGSLSDGEFAKRRQVLPHRVAGVVARMGLLNCDGYAMVDYDRAARQIVLHRGRLAQNYGLKP